MDLISEQKVIVRVGDDTYWLALGDAGKLQEVFRKLTGVVYREDLGCYMETRKGKGNTEEGLQEYFEILTLGTVIPHLAVPEPVLGWTDREPPRPSYPDRGILAPPPAPDTSSTAPFSLADEEGIPFPPPYVHSEDDIPF